MIVKEMVIMIVNYRLFLCRESTLSFRSTSQGVGGAGQRTNSPSDKNVDSAPEKTNIGGICER